MFASTHTRVGLLLLSTLQVCNRMHTETKRSRQEGAETEKACREWRSLTSAGASRAQRACRNKLLYVLGSRARQGFEQVYVFARTMRSRRHSSVRSPSSCPVLSMRHMLVTRDVAGPSG